MAGDISDNKSKKININDFNETVAKTDVGTANPAKKTINTTPTQTSNIKTNQSVDTDIEKIMGPSDLDGAVNSKKQASQQAAGSSAKKSKKFNFKNKWAIVGIIIGVLVILAGIGYLVVINPSFVWWYGMTRTNKAVNNIVDAQVQPARLQSYSKSSINGTANASWLGNTLSGTVTSNFNKSTSKTDVNLDVKTLVQKSNKLSLQLVSQVPSGSTYPDIYFNISGLSALGVDTIMPELSQYQGKWIVVNASLLSSMIPSSSEQNSTSQQPSSADFSNFAKSATKITSNYLFSTNKNMAVFQKQSFVGKESINGVNSYHYKVDINKTNASSYCQAIVTELYSTSFYQKVANQGQNAANLVEKSKAGSIKSCQDSVNNDKNTYELWIDTSHHIVNQIRINDGGNTQTYTDVGQVIQSGGSIEFYIETVDTKAKSDLKAAITLSSNSDDLNAAVTYTNKNTVAPVTANVTLSSKPSNGSVQVTIPANAIPITDVLTKLGLNTTP